MGDQVKVADVETIERFRAALVQAAETFGLALEEAEGDVERTIAWLETERPDTWRKRIRKAQDEVVACKGALYRKQEIKATPEARPSVVDERNRAPAPPPSARNPWPCLNRSSGTPRSGRPSSRGRWWCSRVR